MKWFKHDSNANMDAKIQEVLLEYGLEGYGLYWYCLELIAANVDANNIKFELEHDVRIIARNTGCSVKKVGEMMAKFIELGLFEASHGIITCLKLATRTDEYTCKVLKLAGKAAGKLPTNSRQTPDSVGTKSALLEEKRLDKIRPDNNIYKHIDLSGLPIEISIDDQKSFIDYKIKRAQKKKEPAPTDRAIKQSLNQAVKINNELGISYDEIFGTVEEKGWSGIKLDYFTNQNKFGGQANQQQKENKPGRAFGT